MNIYTVYAHSRATARKCEGGKFVIHAVPASTPEEAMKHPAVVRKFYKMGLTHNKYELSAFCWSA